MEWIVMVHTYKFLFSFIHWWIRICWEADVLYLKHVINILQILNETTINLSQHLVVLLSVNKHNKYHKMTIFSC